MVTAPSGARDPLARGVGGSLLAGQQPPLGRRRVPGCPHDVGRRPPDADPPRTRVLAGGPVLSATSGPPACPPARTLPRIRRTPSSPPRSCAAGRRHGRASSRRCSSTTSARTAGGFLSARRAGGFLPTPTP